MQSINTTLADKLAATRPTHQEIAQCAAQLWAKHGRPSNRDEEIWLEAEQLLLIDRGHSLPKPTRAAPPKSNAGGGSTRSYG